MLRYDAAWLIDQYADETPVAPGIPYALLDGAGPYRMVRDEAPFRLIPATGVQPRLAYDETIVRLTGYSEGTLRVQPCRYSDGVKSNYAMDGERELRAVLRAEYGRRLPPLEDRRLANGVGTAIVVFDSEDRPYLPRRAPGQSVFPAGYHCTASGEAVWQEGELTFQRLVTENICRELEEEAGLRVEDLDWIRPVAFCREFLRAGKPQFFFAARISLNERELQSRRRAAIAGQLARGRQEILDDVLDTPRAELCTIECLANLVLAGFR